LQIEAKVFFAKSGTQFLPDLTDSSRVKDTNVLFPTAIALMGILLDQIGRFSIGEGSFPSIVEIVISCTAG